MDCVSEGFEKAEKALNLVLEYLSIKNERFKYYQYHKKDISIAFIYLIKSLV